MANPFLCGTWAHDVMKSFGHGDNCQNRNERETKPKRKRRDGGMGIPIPKYKNIKEFYASCGVDYDKMVAKRTRGAMPKGWVEDKVLDKCAIF